MSNFKNDNETFINAVRSSTNICQALKMLGMSFRGAAYTGFRKRCNDLNLDLGHFKSEKEIKKSTTKEMLISAVQQAQSRMDCLKQLNLNPSANANLNWLEIMVLKYQLDKSHWLGRGHLIGKNHSWSKKEPIENLLIKRDFAIGTSGFKKRLIKERILKEECYICHITEWREQKLSLQLDHINGDNSDNRKDNLRLLCPNCHSLTPTFCRGKKEIKNRFKEEYDPETKMIIKKCLDCNDLVGSTSKRCKSCAAKFTYEKANKCISCNKVICNKAKRCKSCAVKPTKINWPADEELRQRANNQSLLSLGREKGVSDNAIRKRLKQIQSSVLPGSPTRTSFDTKF